MPFQRGPAPIRRTLQHLRKGPLVFKERVQIMTVNYNEAHKNIPKHTKLDQHQGARDFVFWNLQQVIYLTIRKEHVFLKLYKQDFVSIQL